MQYWIDATTMQCVCVWIAFVSFHVVGFYGCGLCRLDNFSSIFFSYFFHWLHPFIFTLTNRIIVLPSWCFLLLNLLHLVWFYVVGSFGYCIYLFFFSFDIKREFSRHLLPNTVAAKVAKRHTRKQAENIP